MKKSKTTFTIIAMAGLAVFAASCKEQKTTAIDVPGETSAATAEATDDNYPLLTCVVSGEDLGSMGDAYVFEHEGSKVKLCCKSCLKDFNKEPGKYLKVIEEARNKS
ncbi:MAG: hypothetical protein H7Y36_09545 [Armatimonadetes bacterium]|nr:hypothetical protein [Akkermansiaceae bacterium]